MARPGAQPPLPGQPGAPILVRQRTDRAPRRAQTGQRRSAPPTRVVTETTPMKQAIAVARFCLVRAGCARRP